MKKSIVIASMVLATAVASSVFAGAYNVFRMPTPGAEKVKLPYVSKVMQIEVNGSTLATGTVVISKYTPSTGASNLQYSVTCVDGAKIVGLTSTNTFYIAAGDILYRTGTATNGFVRLIVQ